MTVSNFPVSGEGVPNQVFYLSSADYTLTFWTNIFNPLNMCCILISDVLLLQRGLTHTLESAYATVTSANFRSKIRAFVLFTTYFGLILYPVSEDTLCLYAQFLSNSFDSVQAIKSYIQAIKQLHIISGYSVKPFEGIKLQLARTVTKPPRQAQTLSTDILLAIRATLNPLLPNDVVFWCILLVGFFLFARLSNLVKTCYTEFQVKQGQVIWSERLMLLNFTRAKTLQFGEKVLKIPVCQTQVLHCAQYRLTKRSQEKFQPRLTPQPLSHPRGRLVSLYL